MPTTDLKTHCKREREERDPSEAGNPSAPPTLRARTNVNSTSTTPKPSAISSSIHGGISPSSACITSSVLLGVVGHHEPSGLPGSCGASARGSTASTMPKSSGSSSARAAGGSGGSVSARRGGAADQQKQAGAPNTMGTAQRKPVSGMACGPAGLVGKRRGQPPQSTTAAPANTVSATMDPKREVECALWACKRKALGEEVRNLRRTQEQLRRDAEAVRDAVEVALLDHDTVKQALEASSVTAAGRHVERMNIIAAGVRACEARRAAAESEAARLRLRMVALHEEGESAQEAMVLEQERAAELTRELSVTEEAVRAELAQLEADQREEERMRDAAYGLSGEVRDMVLEMEQLDATRRKAEVAAMETEITRRELYSKCEELKGSIRVYCRVKGYGRAAVVATAAGAAEASPASRDTCPESTMTTPARASKKDTDSASYLVSPANGACGSGVLPKRPRDSAASDSTTDSRTQDLKGGASASLRALVSAQRPQQQQQLPSARGSEAGSTVAPSIVPDDAMSEEAVEEIYSYTDSTGHNGGGEKAEIDQFTVPRSITVHQSRQNATSTGKSRSTECFTFDRVFDHRSSQSDVYHEVEPLVHSAIDGYRVCVFAYGQTGSGKTYTMEGSMASEETYGIIPRAIETIFARQEALAKDGWAYKLSCSFVEIYNDVIRDLLRSPQLYEANSSGGTSAAPGSSSLHTIKHRGEDTAVTSVRSTTLTSMADFRKVYRTATNHRRTARTQLNERSSRSHCIFTLNIDGENQTIRQRSAGVLCLVDLAGSERVSDSGVHGQQFKEAVNINKSLLDLGKCIHAMRSGSVAPWRNCKLTYLLQNYLGAKGGKMLMLVNISDRKQHLPESVNSLRFATRVSETVVGASVKRVTNF